MNALGEVCLDVARIYRIALFKQIIEALVSLEVRFCSATKGRGKNPLMLSFLGLGSLNARNAKRARKIGKRREFRFAVEETQGDEVVDGEIATQAGCDFGGIISRVALGGDGDFPLGGFGNEEL